MTLIGINYEKPLDGLIREGIAAGLVTAVEIIPDHEAFGGLEALRALLTGFQVPCSFHFIGNSLGSANFRDTHTLGAFAKMIDLVDPVHYSDHVTCCKAGDIDLSQNIAVPRTPDMVELFVHNIKLMQAMIGTQRKLLLENIASGWDYEQSSLGNAEFYREIVQRGGCYCLLDVHNLYADELNFGLDAIGFIESIPRGLVREVHVSGGSWTPSRRVYTDSHNSKTPPRVFELLDAVLRRADPEIIVLERQTIPRPLLDQQDIIFRDILDDLKVIADMSRRWTNKR